MDNMVVVYESRYGSTEKYAKWIAKDLGCLLLKAKDTSIEDLKKFDTIVYGGWLHAGTIKGFKLISKDIEVVKDKNIIVFSVGCSTGKKEELKGVENANFKGGDNIKHFYLRGGFNYQNLNMMDKILMNMLKIKLKSIKEEDRDEEAKGMLDAYTNPIEFTDRDNIKSLVSYVRSL